MGDTNNDIATKNENQILEKNKINIWYKDNKFFYKQSIWEEIESNNFIKEID